MSVPTLMVQQPKAPMLLVLDLDETLVRVSCEGVHKRQLDRVDFTVSVNIGTGYECKVSVRPGVEEFLSWIQERRRQGAIEGPWIFTTSTARYTKEILRHLDPGGRVFGLNVLTQPACTSPRLPGFFLKDLAHVPPRNNDVDLRRKVLVDNNPVSCVINPDHSVLIRDWLGKDEPDEELARVSTLLDNVIADSGHGDEVDYAAALSRIMPGQSRFRDQLLALGQDLNAEPATEVPALRQAMRAVSAECLNIKKDLLGAAP
jgi:TFIIF-interacting CTD phosphatase-like protein